MGPLSANPGCIIHTLNGLLLFEPKCLKSNHKVNNMKVFHFIRHLAICLNANVDGSKCFLTAKSKYMASNACGLNTSWCLSMYQRVSHKAFTSLLPKQWTSLHSNFSLLNSSKCNILTCPSYSFLLQNQAISCFVVLVETARGLERLFFPRYYYLYQVIALFLVQNI